MSKRALLIGINYRSSDAELKGCITDVKNMRSVLVNNCGYKTQNVRSLTEDEQVKPTRQNIEENIKWLVTNCLPGDTLFFHFSGHGSFVNDSAGGDETDRRDEVIIPLDYLTKGVISDDWLFSNMIAKVPANVTLWVFADCCHSGTMVDLKYNYKSLCALKQGSVKQGMRYVPAEWSDRFSFSMERSREIVGNVCLLSGCLDQETAADASINNTFQGAFTYCFLEFVMSNLIKMPDGSSRFRNTVKLRNILKELNCRLDIQGFTRQQSQLSVGKQSDFERVFNP
jgi:hypothetical protein